MTGRLLGEPGKAEVIQRIDGRALASQRKFLCSPHSGYGTAAVVFRVRSFQIASPGRLPVFRVCQVNSSISLVHRQA